MTKETAQRLSDLARSIGAQLNESVRWVQEAEQEPEFLEYRKAVGKIMGAIYFEIMEPLYGEHPDTLPDVLRGERE